MTQASIKHRRKKRATLFQTREQNQCFIRTLISIAVQSHINCTSRILVFIFYLLSLRTFSLVKGTHDITRQVLSSPESMYTFARLSKHMEVDTINSIPTKSQCKERERKLCREKRVIWSELFMEGGFWRDSVGSSHIYILFRFQFVPSFFFSQTS